MAFGVKRTHLLSVVDAILRVPSLFLIHVWCLVDPHETAREFTGNSQSALLVTTVYFFVLLYAISIAILPLRKLVDLYIYIISGFLLYVAYYVSSVYVAGLKINVKDPTDPNWEQWVLKHLTFRTLVVVQCVVGSLITYLTEVQSWKKYGFFIFILPLMEHARGIPIDFVETLHDFAVNFTIFILALFAFTNLCNVLFALRHFLDFINLINRELKILINSINRGYMLYDEFVYLFNALIIYIIVEIIHLPRQLLVFWLCLFSVRFYVYFYPDLVLKYQWNWFFLVLGDSCETNVSLIALCITISYVSYCIILLAKLFVQGFKDFQPDNNHVNGCEEGLIMLLLAFQNGSLNVTAVHRGKLIIVCLTHVVSVLFKSMYDTLDPILLSLGAQYNRNLGKHARVTLLFLLLLICPLYMAYSIFKFFNYDYFILLYMSGCLLTSARVVDSLIIYTLFLYDALRTEPWDTLDGVIFKVRSTTRLLEFFVIFLSISFILKDIFIWKWTWINLFLLISYCVYLWYQIQTQWIIFMLRRQTIKRLESLPLATYEQLEEYNDVCAICYQSMTAARITHCKHLFHATCLKKWLYVKNTCPMCKRRIDQSEEGDATHDDDEYDDEDSDNGNESESESNEDEDNEVSDKSEEIFY